MRISDWSSDVCSSDLFAPHLSQGHRFQNRAIDHMRSPDPAGLGQRQREASVNVMVKSKADTEGPGLTGIAFVGFLDQRDRKSVVEGKSVSVRVDLGGRRIIKKKNKKIKNIIKN